MMISSWKQLSEFKLACDTAVNSLETKQQRWLLHSLRRNRQTEYGRRYCFEKMDTVAAYRESVPVTTYKDYRKYINLIEKGKSDALFSGKAVAFEKTSGSSDSQKLIPYSVDSLLDFRHAILPWLSSLVRQYAITSGSAYFAISPATREQEVTSGGVPVGLPDAAYLGEDIIPFFQNASTVPLWLSELKDIKDWQLATLYYLVCSEDLVLISIWSPTFILSLLDALQTRKLELLELVGSGGEIQGNQLKNNTVATENLKLYYQTGETKKLWPALKVISCWADASSHPFYKQLREHFPYAAIQSKGLLLTEGVVTIPNDHNKPVLAIDSGFYEFIDSESNLKLAHELNIGESYEVVMTTAGGLYRYRTYDRVKCEAYHSDRPVLRFVGRGNYTSDLVGEKLTDEFVNQCLADIPGFRMLLPDIMAGPGYLLVLDKSTVTNEWKIIEQVERNLSKNPQYAYARKLGQLSELKPLLLDNPLKYYLSSPVHKGTRIGDIKVPSLCTKKGIFNKQIGAAA